MIKYNEQQLRAISHREGPMLVLAGPGCGKTAVITGRIAALVMGGVSPRDILSVTFTKAAALEMKRRFESLVGEEGAGVVFGTFHSIFFNILRQERHLDSGCILAEDAKIGFLKEILKLLYGDRLYEFETVLSLSREISLVKGNGISVENFYSNTFPYDEFQEIYKEYTRFLAENRRLDFDDINSGLYALFKNEPETLKKWSSRFKYILVDEFQDINPIQYGIVDMLANPLYNLFAVGDDDQAIYRFRGSDPSYMLGFPKKYKNCAVVNLSCNYRCAPDISEAAQKVIRVNKGRFKKEHYTQKERGGLVSVCSFENVWEEAEALSGQIKKALSEGFSYGDIAVLTRTNAGSRSIIEKFISEEIPFAATQSIPCVFEHFIAKDLLAYLGIAQGSEDRRDFIRVINKPNRYITKNALYGKGSVFENMYMYYEDRRWMWERIEQLENELSVLKDMPLYGALSYIRKVIAYDDYIREYCAENGIVADELFHIADEIVESSRSFLRLADWKKHIEEYMMRTSSRKEKGEGKNSVVISTLHGSKGKEYGIVFIVDVNSGNIPYRKAVLKAEIEEERRLFYVGMTRAKERLFIYYVKNRFEKQSEPSIFLDVLLKGREA